MVDSDAVDDVISMANEFAQIGIGIALSVFTQE